jgi:hypothetical protein
MSTDNERITDARTLAVYFDAPKIAEAKKGLGKYVYHLG